MIALDFYVLIIFHFLCSWFVCLFRQPIGVWTKGGGEKHKTFNGFFWPPWNYPKCHPYHAHRIQSLWSLSSSPYFHRFSSADIIYPHIVTLALQPKNKNQNLLSNSLAIHLFIHKVVLVNLRCAPPFFLFPQLPISLTFRCTPMSPRTMKKGRTLNLKLSNVFGCTHAGGRVRARNVFIRKETPKQD